MRHGSCIPDTTDLLRLLTCLLRPFTEVGGESEIVDPVTPCLYASAFVSAGAVRTLYCFVVSWYGHADIEAVSYVHESKLRETEGANSTHRVYAFAAL